MERAGHGACSNALSGAPVRPSDSTRPLLEERGLSAWPRRCCPQWQWTAGKDHRLRRQAAAATGYYRCSTTCLRPHSGYRTTSSRLLSPARSESRPTNLKPSAPGALPCAVPRTPREYRQKRDTPRGRCCAYRTSASFWLACLEMSLVRAPGNFRSTTTQVIDCAMGLPC